MLSRVFEEAMSAYDDGKLRDAIALMEECAQGDDPVACFLTALWYREDVASKENIEASDAWLQRLKDLAFEGNTAAQWELGQQYRFGNLYPLDVEQANYFLDQAANSGNADAQFHLSCFLETGSYGYTRDLATAKIWFERALEQGHPEATYVHALSHFVDGRPTEEAIRLLRVSAEGGFRQSQALLHKVLD